MRKNKLFIWQISAIIFSIVFGVILHFTYEWSGQNRFIGYFSAINESTWEHLKLAFAPMIIFAIIESFFIKSNSYWQGKSLGIFISLVSVVTIFYTYTGVLGYGTSFINIALFIVSVILGEIVSYFVIKSDFNNSFTKKLAIILLVVLAIQFVMYTYMPPNIALFISPV